MEHFRHNKKLGVLIAFVVILLASMCYGLIMLFRTGEEASVGIFSLAMTLLGTVFIALELKNGQNVTCSDMLINLNNYFHDSDRLMKVYELLETPAETPEEHARVWADVKDVELAQYCTFFENLYLLYKNDIAAIDDLDDLFGYRFFIFVNNPFIQENYILLTSSSYAQIFKLYEAWICYRKQTDKDWQKHMPHCRYAFSEQYLKKQLYMYDEGCREAFAPICWEANGQTLAVRQASFRELSKIAALQDSISVPLSNDIYCPLTREELLESLHLDLVLGVFAEGERLVAAAIIVKCRESDRNLAHDLGTDPGTTMTFDAVFVDPDRRGLGLQRALIQQAVAIAKSKGIRTIGATVSPDNPHSLDNFLAEGFSIKATKSKYGSTRHLLAYTLN